jgi:hypothetical protein
MAQARFFFSPAFFRARPKAADFFRFSGAAARASATQVAYLLVRLF